MSHRAKGEPTEAVLERARAIEALDEVHQALKREWADPQTYSLTDRLWPQLRALRGAVDRLVSTQASVATEETCSRCDGEGMEWFLPGGDWDRREWARCGACGGSGRA